jgi:tetratricopeptide (TPR) repeat protein
MARKLSAITPRRLILAIAVGALLVAVQVSAESPVQVSEAANVIENPFVSSQSATQPEPQAQPKSHVGSEPKMPRRLAANYQNPFAASAKAPPVDTSLRPGPVSRWRRPTLPGEEVSAVKSAVLARPHGEPDWPTWDMLPPAEDLRHRATAHGIESDPTFYSRLTASVGTIQFTPKPLTQPGWLTEFDEPIATDSDSIPVDPALFDSPLVAIEAANQAATQLAAHADRAGLVANAFAIDPIDAAPSAGVALGVGADSVDTPAGWLEQAQNAAAKANSAEDLSAVIEMCDRGLRSSPDGKLTSSLRRLAAWAHNRRGEIRADADQPEDALRDFQAAIALDSSCSLAIHNRAVTFAQQNEFDAALRDFNRVIELNPGLAVAYRNRAELLAATDRIEEAIADYSQAIEGLPNDPHLYRGRGYAFQRLGQFSKALADYNRAIEMAPNDAEIFTMRGNLAAEQGDYRRAIKDFRRALSVDAASAEAHRSLAWLLATCPNSNYQNSEQAVAAAERAASLAANDYMILDTLAAALASAGEFERAIEIERQAIANAPPEMAAAFDERLALYQHGQAFRSGPTREGSR